ncbi:MAG: sigma-70 family RNA polymerase sigma factor [Acidobacteriota bacterium]
MTSERETQASPGQSTSPESDVTDQLVDHFFRHESAKLVALLTRVFGLHNLDLVEDVVQSALLRALESWKFKGVPADPTAWVYRVARNRALDVIRRRSTAEKYGPDVAWLEAARDSDCPLDELFLDREIQDSQLRMIFACCRDELAPESQIALALKILCGFSVAEISRALLGSEASVKKRIYRAKQQLAAHRDDFQVPDGDDLAGRLESVHGVLYLLFNEGYNSQHPDELIRRDLCEEAIRLCHQLSEHPCASPATRALLALMMLHAARFDARLDSEGGILRLEDQDRERWHRPLIVRGLEFLDASAAGDTLTRYHLEAGIAAQHCLAPSFEATDWPTIRGLYDHLVRLHPTPVGELNRAIVIAQIDGPAAGIAAIESAPGLRQLGAYHLLDATLGELHLRAGNRERARTYFESASAKTRSLSERRHLVRRLHACDASAES